MTAEDRRAAWDARYGAATVWSGSVNETVRTWAEAHPPRDGASALDLACGEGADALWLAERGWRVTGVDFAPAAIARARAAADERGLAVTWIAADLTAWRPDDTYSLVTLSFFHEAEDVRHAVWGTAASAVAEGGTLQVSAHAADPDPHAPGPPPGTRFDVGELAEVVGGGWTIVARMSRRQGVGHHAGHVMTDLVAELTRA